MSAGSGANVSLTAAAKLPDGKRLSEMRIRLMLADVERERVKRGLSVCELATRATLTERHYFKLLNGQCRPSAKALRQLARAVVMTRPYEGQRGHIEALALDGLRFRLGEAGFVGQVLRDAVIYGAHVLLGLTQKAAAVHAGVTPQRVSVVVRKIEDMREADPALDRALDAAVGAS
jgi:hypothetical protein